MNVCIFVLLTVTINKDEWPRTFLPAANLSYRMCKLRFKTRIIYESLLFIYLSIHFILSVPQGATYISIFVSVSKPRRCPWCWKNLTSYYNQCVISTCQPLVIQCCLFMVSARVELCFLLSADLESIDVASGSSSHTFAPQLN